MKKILGYFQKRVNRKIVKKNKEKILKRRFRDSYDADDSSLEKTKGYRERRRKEMNEMIRKKPHREEEFKEFFESDIYTDEELKNKNKAIDRKKRKLKKQGKNAAYRKARIPDANRAFGGKAKEVTKTIRGKSKLPRMALKGANILTYAMIANEMRLKAKKQHKKNVERWKKGDRPKYSSEMRQR